MTTVEQTTTKDYETIKATDHNRKQLVIVDVKNKNGLELNEANFHNRTHNNQTETEIENVPQNRTKVYKPSPSNSQNNFDGHQRKLEQKNHNSTGTTLSHKNNSNLNSSVRLSRDRWPKVFSDSDLDSDSDSVSFENKQNRNSKISESTISKNNTNKEEEPLIHTDKLNTTSPLLYIHQPHHHRTHSNLLDNQAAESNFSPSKVSILSASYPNMPPPIANLLNNQEHSGDSGDLRETTKSDLFSTTTKTIPRLVILNLEVGSSSATLTWNLELYNNNNDNQNQRNSLVATTIESQNKKQLAADGMSIPNPTTFIDGDEFKRRKDRSLIDLELDEQKSNNRDQLEEEKRFKRDTSKVTANLKASAPSTSSSSSSSEDKDKDLKAANNSKRLPTSTSTSPSPNVEELVLTDDDDDLEIVEEDQLEAAGRKKDNNQKTTKDNNLHIHNNNDNNTNSNLTVSKRLQLSRIKSLPASSNKRPPVRNSTTPGTLSNNKKNIDEDDVGDINQEDFSISIKNTTTATNPIQVDKHSVTNQKVPTRKINTQNDAPIIKIPSIPINRLSINNSTRRLSKNSMVIVRRDPKSLGFGVDSQNSTASSNSSFTSTTPMPITTTKPNLSFSAHLNQENKSQTLADFTTKSIQLMELTPTNKSLATSTTSDNPAPTQTPIISVSRSSLITSTTNNNNIESQSQKRKPLSLSLSSSSSSSTDQNGPAENVSKWLVRLRRFGSNEVDIVQIVANNTMPINYPFLINNKPILRYISFNKLEPSSAYEICIESASPNQQVGDMFQILDANHFLKCHDTSNDMEIVNTVTDRTNEDNSNNQTSLLDLGNLKSPLDEQQHTTNSSFSKLPLINNQKIKISLCKEFFTLPLNSPVKKINFGLSSPLTDDLDSNFYKNKTNNLRKPKSLSNVLKSRMEILEINQPFGFKDNTQDDNNKNNKIWFEMAASSSPSNGKLSPIASDNNANYMTIPRHPSDNNQFNSINHSINNNNYLTMSILPFIGCVFGLILILTLANIILNAITCQTTTKNKRHKQIKSSKLNQHQHHHKPTLASSFYSSNGNNGNQDDMNTLKSSRIVVIGKNGDPFNATSAYFDLPNLNNHNQNNHHGNNNNEDFSSSIDCTSSSGASNSNFFATTTGSGAIKNSSTANLLASAARFPLGPSFEGDEKHNADMVGLARKNYDNFINNIYGGDDNYNNQGQNYNNQNHYNKSNRLSSAYSSQEGVLKIDDISSNNYNNKCQRGSNHKHCHQHHHSKQNKESIQIAKETINKKDTFVLMSSNNNLQNNKNDNLSKRQRIKFDKINPIYNMDSLYANTTISSTQDLLSSNRKQFNGTTFKQPSSANMSPSTSSTSSCLQVDHLPVNNSCPACEIEKSSQEQQFDVVECDGENCEDGSLYTCCLDRQKQRFHKQQQQLERVMTKNGSLVPQPFINPTGINPVGSGDYLFSNEVENLNATEDVNRIVANINKEDKDNFDNQLEENNKEQQEIVDLNVNSTAIKINISDENSKLDDSNQIEPPIPPPLPSPPTMVDNYLMFDDETNDKKVYYSNNNTTTTLPSNVGSKQPKELITKDDRIDKKKSMTMKELPKTKNETFIKSTNTLVNIKPISGENSYLENKSEAINKEDFEQRRNELANKLNLVGMAKPN